jgi:sugar/nucleoside kinase (ribokinase family)
MKVLVGGSVAIDNVKTPEAEAKGLLGGSASYASLAAAKLATPVHLVGIVGHDFPTEPLEMLEREGVQLTGLERSDQPSFTWTGEYHENMNDRTTHNVAINVLEHWQVSVPGEHADAPFVVLANMAPLNQLQMLSQCTAADRFVVADTMDLWITVANEELHEVLRKIDLLVINEGEAREFACTNNLVCCGEILRSKGPRYVVVKLGEFGALLFGPDGSFFRCGAWPLREIADPTGAGDTFLGGLTGFLAARGAVNPEFGQLKEAVVTGSILASFTCENFSTKSLEKAKKDDFLSRLEGFRAHSSW